MIINAIEHGNLNISFDEKTDTMMNNNYMEFITTRKNNPKYEDKKVIIDYSVNEEELVYIIKDEGEGFNHQKFTNVQEDDTEGEMLTHGRGIAITMNVFDTVEFNEKGNQVTLVKKINNRE